MKMSSMQTNDLKDHILSTVSIDQFKSKLGNDENVVVLAIHVKDAEPAKDLSMFIEKGHDLVDVDTSPGPDNEGYYKVYVEIARDSNLYTVIEKVLDDVKRADNEIDAIMFKSYNVKEPQPFNKENLNASVISSSYEYTLATNPEAQAISERIKFLNSY